MARVSGPLKSSANAGQLSKGLWGKVNLKQYYSGAKRMLGVEPVPQAGFALMPGSTLVGSGGEKAVTKGVLSISRDLSYVLIVSSGRVDVWRSDRVRVASLTGGAIAAINPSMVPHLRFYGEADTFGIFHPDIWSGIRLVRNALDDRLWTVSDWPFGDLPKVDLGGDYPKTDDVWTMHVRWAQGVEGLTFSLSVDGDFTSSIVLKNDAGAAIAPDSAGAAQWQLLAEAMAQALTALPGLSAGVTVEAEAQAGRAISFVVTFAGELSGAEYQFDAQITNTSNASVLSSHTHIGETEGEPLVSSSQGGFAGMSLYQDRACYFGARARSASIAMSRIGEYFDLNIESQQDNAARLDALRTDTSEEMLYLLDATYLLAFTDQGVYFASNRTVERNKPMNWVNVFEDGIKRNCPPVKLEGRVYFVGADGGRLYSISYDAVSEGFAPVPENDLNGADAEDLVRDILTMAVQRKTADMAADRLWILREDGRLVCCIINRTQEIMAACEWPIAGGGFARGLAVDGTGQVWLTIERGGVICEEVLDEDGARLFQMALAVTTDLAGQASGLQALEGRTVWAEIDGDVHGPFTVAAGRIETGMASRPAKIGIWQAPVYESMPYVSINGNDDVLRRPGKVGHAHLYVEDTTSLAVGANGRAVRDVALGRQQDDLSAPRAGFTGHVSVTALIGACMDPTITISQVRPGRLRLRDYIPGVKL